MNKRWETKDCKQTSETISEV